MQDLRNDGLINAADAFKKTEEAKFKYVVDSINTAIADRKNRAFVKNVDESIKVLLQKNGYIIKDDDDENSVKNGTSIYWLNPELLSLLSKEYYDYSYEKQQMLLNGKPVEESTLCTFDVDQDKYPGSIFLLHKNRIVFELKENIMYCISDIHLIDFPVEAIKSLLNKALPDKWCISKFDIDITDLRDKNRHFNQLRHKRNNSQ